MLAPFPVFLKSAASSSTAKMNDSGDNLLDIIDLFPYSESVTPPYELPPRPPRPPRNPARAHNEFIPFINRRAPPRHPPPTAPLPPLPPESDSIITHLNKLPQPMYPAPGGLSPWSAPLYPSKPIPTPPSPPKSEFILRGPVGVPLSDSGAKPIFSPPNSEDSPASDAALALNVHGGIDASRRIHHRFRRYQVPYPRNYERNVLDLYVYISSLDLYSHLSRDAIDTLLTRQMSGGSLTWHAFPQSWNRPSAEGPLKK
ncbi:hypothetical protein BDR07DRAFT_1334386, partial [Suillus spraguei]